MIITVIAILIAVLIIIVVTNIGNNSSGNNKKPHTYEPWVIEAPEKRAGRRGEHIATEIIYSPIFLYRTMESTQNLIMLL